MHAHSSATGTATPAAAAAAAAAAHSPLHTTSGQWDRTALHSAVCSGNAETVQQLLHAGASVGEVDSQQWTPLHLAAVRGLHHICLLLLEHGAEASSQDLMGRTPLHLTARSRSEAVATHLLSYGASAAAVDAAGRTPLHDAALRGASGLVEMLLQHLDDPVAAMLQTDVRGLVPLQCAAHRGHEQVVRLLLPAVLQAPAHEAEAVIKSAALAAARSSYTQVAVLLLKQLGGQSPAVTQVVAELQAQGEGEGSSALLAAVVLQWVTDCEQLPRQQEQLQREQEDVCVMQRQVQSLCLAVAGALRELQAAAEQDTSRHETGSDFLLM